MNENEKMQLPEEQTSLGSSTEMETTNSQEQAALETACVETESPALAISEAAEKAEEPATPQSEVIESAEPDAESHLARLHELSKEELVGEMKEILDKDNMLAHKEVNLMKQRFFNIRKQETEAELNEFVAAGNQLEAFSATPCALEAEFQTLYSDFKERRAAYLEKEENRRQENLALKIKAIEGIRELMEDLDNINRNFPKFQQFQQDFKEIKDIPQQAETEIWKQYQSVVEEFYDLLKLNKELRDLDFKKNLEAKRELIESAKALTEHPDAVEASHRLQELHNQWREIGPVAKDIREELWEEFRGYSSVINRRHQEYFEARKAQEFKNEEAKTRLCEEVEKIDIDALKAFADWDKETEHIKNLQAEWKTIGFASRKNNNALFARFRKKIDEFFQKKTDFYKTLREELHNNLVKKTALCEKAEALAEMENVVDAAKKALELQEEWKTIGGVERKQSDAIWQRFRKACNAIFERRRGELEEKKNSENANLTAKQEILAALKAIYEETEESGDSIRRTRALQEQWRNIGFVPFSKKEALNEEYKEIIAKLTAKLNMGVRRGKSNGNAARRMNAI
ncbi:MAG: DUF349 domain-containing protein, partial [Muribaculaceae bacterium]|nr:DUF349 domain-containing protein [Muribaculaceae bacterium]